MKRAVILRQEPSELPKCCAKLTDPQSKAWRKQFPKEGVEGFGCGRNASVTIDGKPYCKQHGGPIAIEILANMEGVKQ